MNIHNLLTQIEQVDPEIYERLDSRRSVFKHFAGFGKKLAATAVPLAFGAMLNKAYGQTTTRSVTDVLKFAFLLENLEAEFYKQAAATNIFATPAGKMAFETIRNHEVSHVAFLQAALGANAPTYSAASFDYTAGGLLANTFTDYPTMLAVAQAFEDTGVRAYKGQAAFLISNNDVLQAALQIHSVEARHAAHIRRMRRDMMTNPAMQKPWITGKDLGGLPAIIQPVYDGEEATTQAGVKISGTFGGVTISDAAASEAFDEVLTTEQVTTIVTPFLKQ